MPQQTKIHRFMPRPVKKGRRTKIKRVRVGSRNPGATGQGSTRRPF